jgi:hypothetical protein
MKSQDNRYKSAENPVLIHGVSLCDVNVGMWCVCECKYNNGAIFFQDLKFTLMTPFYEHVYASFSQTMQHMTL